MTLIIPLILSPLWVSHLYQLEFENQKRQIWLDNASIVLGRNDRELLNKLESTKKKIESLHTTYHQAQACSLIPKIATVCASLANQIKHLLLACVNSVLSVSQIKWRAGNSKALEILGKKGYQGQLTRLEKIPLQRKKCGICFESVLIEMPRQPIMSVLKLKNQLIPPDILLVEKNTEGRWNYRLQ